MNMIDAETVHQCISYRELVDGLYQLHRENPCDLNDILLKDKPEDAENFMLVRAAFQGGQAIGVKMASIFPKNENMPSIQAVFVLFDGCNGEPLGLVDGTALTYRKTASDSALGSHLLSRPDSRSLLMVGAGSMSMHLIEAHLVARPSLEKVSIWNRTPARAQEIASMLTKKGIDITVKCDLESAVKEADVISCATMSITPIIQGQWLNQGTHLDLVGAYRPDMREADDECLLRSRLFVDSRKTTIGEIGEIEIPLQQGVISEETILGDLYDMCKPGFDLQRTSDDITVFKNGGGAHLDLMTARLIYDHANNS